MLILRAGYLNSYSTPHVPSNLKSTIFSEESFCDLYVSIWWMIHGLRRPKFLCSRFCCIDREPESPE